MSLSFSKTAYENNYDCISWLGLKCSDDEQFADFLTTKTAKRLDDTEGNDEFRNHLNGLALTGLGKENLAAVLNADQPEQRSCADSFKEKDEIEAEEVG